MIRVKAPEGYEACRFYEDGTKQWVVSARVVGDTWWTNGYTIGHTHLVSAELDARAQVEAMRLCEHLAARR